MCLRLVIRRGGCQRERERERERERSDPVISYFRPVWRKRKDSERSGKIVYLNSNLAYLFFISAKHRDNFRGGVEKVRGAHEPYGSFLRWFKHSRIHSDINYICSIEPRLSDIQLTGFPGYLTGTEKKVY